MLIITVSFGILKKCYNLTMLENFKKIINSLINFLYINKCIVCGKNAEEFICQNCTKEINFLSDKPIKIYKRIPIYCATLYETSIKKLIKSLKFYRKKHASIVLSKILYRYFSKLKIEKNFIIIYPPAYFAKNIRRGYCHMELIAEEFSKLTGFEIEKKLIKKIKYTKPQYKARNRKKNIENSFIINNDLKEKYKDASVLLIDDITTSGATIETLTDILLESGINDITVLVIAKAGN